MSRRYSNNLQLCNNLSFSICWGFGVLGFWGFGKMGPSSCPLIFGALPSNAFPFVVIATLPQGPLIGCCYSWKIECCHKSVIMNWLFLQSNNKTFEKMLPLILNAMSKIWPFSSHFTKSFLNLRLMKSEMNWPYQKCRCGGILYRAYLLCDFFSFLFKMAFSNQIG